MPRSSLIKRLGPAGAALAGAVALLAGGGPARAHRDSTAPDARTGTYTVTLLRVTLESGPWDTTDGVEGPPAGVPLGPFKLLIHTITRAGGHDTEDALLGPYRAIVPRHIQEKETDRTGINKVIYRHTDCSPFEPVVFRANASLLRDHGGGNGLRLPGGLSENPENGGIVSVNGAATEPGTLNPTGESADTQRNTINRALTLPGSFPLPSTPHDERGVLAEPGVHRIVGRLGDNVFDGPVVYEVRVSYVSGAGTCGNASIPDPPPYGPPPGHDGAPKTGPPGPAPNAPGSLGEGAQGAGGSTAVVTLEAVQIDSGPFDAVDGLSGGPAKGVPTLRGRLLAHTVVRGPVVEHAVVGLPTVDTPHVIQLKNSTPLDFEKVIYQHSSCTAPRVLHFAATAALVHHRLPTILELATVDPGGIVSVDGKLTYPGTTILSGETAGSEPADIAAALRGKGAVRLPAAPRRGSALLTPGKRYGIVGTEARGFDDIVYYVRYDVVPASLPCPSSSTSFAVTQQAGYDHTVSGGPGHPSTVCSDITTAAAQPGAAFTATLDPPGFTVQGTLDDQGHGRVVFGIPSPGTYSITVVVGSQTSRADVVVPPPDADHMKSKSCAAPPAPS